MNSVFCLLISLGFNSFLLPIKRYYAACLTHIYTHQQHTYMFAYALCMLFSGVVVFVRALNALKCSHFVLQLALHALSAVALVIF